MKRNYLYQHGLSLIELMIALVVGLLIVLAMLGVYLAQTQIYRTSVSQSAIQNIENAISALITPIIRSAGFSGCNTVVRVLSNLNTISSPPLSTLSSTATMVYGYESTTDLTQYNAVNDTTASHWSPSLDATLVGNVEAGSDVLVIVGAVPFSTSIGVTTIAPGSNSLVIQNSSGLISGQFGVISDCAKASLFQITDINGTTISHIAGSGAATNASSTLLVNYPVGAQFIPIQQTVLFVGQGPGGQSALMQGVLTGTTGSTWTIQPLVPGIDVMQIQYGVGINALVTQYVTANNVTNWSNVYSIRLGFIIEGQGASGSSNRVNPTQFTVLGNTITVPADNRLRHVYEMTIYLRNATL
jgi:type IV pilus assembly protein PilW